MGMDSTGHDWYHIDRVRKLALYIAKCEGQGDLFVIEMASLLHDISDEKLNSSLEEGKNKLRSFIQSLSLSTPQASAIIDIIENISFKGGNESTLHTFEQMAVRDADRLDAIGAIGIARAFAYGGKKGQLLYDPNLHSRENMTIQEYRTGKSSTVHHFYEKLLLLKDKMLTNTGKQIALERHQYLETFLKQFFKEWNGDYEVNNG
ncbi:HD domain-containing protein [Heyndrickxia camelliae]|uniref:Phosphohydrolase n=1 Tax=Heyndrickxia camelliae TaxID=1707093 RepID=A0A2N3LNE0_9BACI|nr:HD domain-containing protein [Heyndrickxia camelliae]PKR86141.1 phosphohydrolase [Heyndrickxia camelliae]